MLPNTDDSLLQEFLKPANEQLLVGSFPWSWSQPND
jgi:hypothetical protein